MVLMGQRANHFYLLSLKCTNVCSVFLVKYPKKMDFQLSGKNMNGESNDFSIHGNNAKMPVAKLELFGKYQITLFNTIKTIDRLFNSFHSFLCLLHRYKYQRTIFRCNTKKYLTAPTLVARYVASFVTKPEFKKMLQEFKKSYKQKCLGVL